jgi:hypothetical protein
MWATLVLDCKYDIEHMLKYLRHPGAMDHVTDFHGFELEIKQLQVPHPNHLKSKKFFFRREIRHFGSHQPIINGFLLIPKVQDSTHLHTKHVVKEPVEDEQCHRVNQMP